MKRLIFVAVIVLPMLGMCSCTNQSKDAAVMGVDFEWQPIDYDSDENPEIQLTGVPDGTVRFLVSLIDLDLKTYDHGSGFVDNDQSGTIGRGTVKGAYKGPAPWLPGMIHTYEITVRAYDEKGRVIGIGKNAKKFPY